MGTLRIVAGELRGRKIPVRDVDGVRPTPDRVREALFNILGQTLAGLDVLDAFAGSGALGFEALSRGARAATFVESDPGVARDLVRTAESLGVSERTRVVAGAVERELPRLAHPGFDLVLADPPYASGLGEVLLRGLARTGAVRPGGRVVVERESRRKAPLPPPGWTLTRTAVYGRTALDFYQPGQVDSPR